MPAEHFVNQSISLEKVYEIYKKWLHVEDTKRIDAVLAVALSQKMSGLPLWLFIIGASGDGKTEQIKALDDGDVTTKRLDSITSKTLIQGNKGHEDDLMPQLQDKLILISDFSQFLKMHPDEKGQVWAQLRQLYDGEMTKAYGTGAKKTYKGIKTTMIVGVTPAIDSQILIFQELGTRELFYRTEEALDFEFLKKKVWDNEGYEEVMQQELNTVTRAFLDNKKVERIKISADVKKTLFEWVDYLRYLRASAEIESSTGECINIVYPEACGRLLKQLKKLFLCLKNLDKDYTDERALLVISKVIESSIVPLRKEVLMQVIKNNSGITTSQVANNVRIGKRTATSHLSVLRGLYLIDMEEKEDNFGRVIERTWYPEKNNKIIKSLMPKEKLDDF